MSDKAIRAAKLTAAGILDKARARTAVTRAGGQIAPSKYLPNVPRQVHADGGRENGDGIAAAETVAAMLRDGRGKEVTNDHLNDADPQHLWKLYETGQTGMDLPMDSASRMERAKAMGMSHDGYHSSLNDLTSFKPTGKFMGHKGTSGISTTENPKVANRYLDRFGDINYKGQPFEKNVMKTVANLGKVTVQDMPYPMDRYGPNMGDPLPSWYIPEHVRRGFDTAQFPDEISTKGKVRHSGNLRSTETIMSDPTKIRSVFARFDPRLAHLSHLSAATGGRIGHADGGEVTDLGQAREQKQLQTFSNNMRTDINQRVNTAMEAHQKAVDAGVFDGYEVGDVLKGSAHPMRITGRFMRKWKPTPMALQSFDRMGAKPTIIEHEGEQYIPMLRYETGVEEQDGWQRGDAYLDGVKAAGYQKMGGLRSVKARGGQVSFQAGNHPDVPEVLYHGSAPKVATKGWTDEIDEDQTAKNIAAQDFKEFKPSAYGSFGEGIYLSDSPKIASDFAQGIRADQSEVKPHGQVMKLHVSMKQPFHDGTLRHPAWIDYIKGEINQALDWRSGRRQDVSEKEMADALLKKLDSGTATVRDLFLHDTPEGTMVNQFGQDRIHKTIRNSGFDGIIAHRPDGSKEYVAFKPEQVKSALSAKTYDPTNPDMTFSDGGAVPQKTVKADGGSVTTQSRDGSGIFGEGATIHRYVHPETDSHIEVLERRNGPASVLGLEVPEEHRGKGIGQMLQAEAMARHPALMGQVSSKAAATTAYRLGRRPYSAPDATLDDVFSAIDRDSSVNMLSPQAQPKAAGGAAMFEGIHPDLQDENGNPLDLWHGTPGEGFDEFKDDKLGSRDAGFFGRGHYLTPIKGNAEGYADPDEMGAGTVMGPLHAALKNPYVWDTSDSGSHRTLRDLQSMGIMKGQGKLEPWDNLQRHHIDPFMREMQNRGHDGVLVKGDNGLSEVVVFKPNMIKHRDAEVFDPNDARIMRAGGGRLGLYSKAAKLIRALPQEKGTVDHFIAAARLKDTPELRNAGTLPSGKITRDELAAILEARLPKLKVEQYGENPSRLNRDENQRRLALQNRGEPLSPEEKTEQERLNRRLMSSPNVLSDEETEEPLDTEYGGYRLPGGQNYRERLISLQRPKDPRDDIEKRLKKLTETQNAWPEGHPARDRFDDEINDLRGKLETMPTRKEPATYQSSHWAGHPNVLAHIRMQDKMVGGDRSAIQPIMKKLAAGLGVGIRDLASGAASVGIQNKIITPQEAASLSRFMGWRNGYDQAPGIEKRLLHVEELQSDWAQEGRDQGFADTENPYEVFNKKTKKVISRHPSYSAAWDAYRAIPEDQAADLDTGKSTGPSTAPYVTNTQHWTDLALKHVLHEAAMGNYDGIVFTPGQAQADRYGLEKQVDNLSYHPSTKTLMAMKGNRVVFSKDGMEPEEVASHVGRDVSQRLMHPDAMQKFDDGDSFYNIFGDDLKMGGEGMKGYYDNIVPKSVMRLAQQHDPEAKASGPIDLGQGYSGFHLPMTDTLKNSIIDKGFPAMKRGGSVDAALAATRRFTKDGKAATMRLKAKGD